MYVAFVLYVRKVYLPFYRCLLVYYKMWSMIQNFMGLHYYIFINSQIYQQAATIMYYEACNKYEVVTYLY